MEPRRLTGSAFMTLTPRTARLKCSFRPGARTLQAGKKYADNDGNVHPPGIGNPDSPHYNENAVNDTHIPIQGNSNLNPKGTP